jgi:hypothetical protein
MYFNLKANYCHVRALTKNANKVSRNPKEELQYFNASSIQNAELILKIMSVS